MGKTIITVALIGSAPSRRQNPHIPITPEEIARSAVQACRAGASVAHVHVRDPETELACNDLSLFQETVHLIRKECDIILNLSTGYGGRIAIGADGRLDPAATTLQSAEQRVAHVLDLKPELCSLDIGTMNFGPGIFVNAQPVVDGMAQLIQQAGIKPEVELFDVGHIEIYNRLSGLGLVDAPVHFQLCMGTAGGMAATPRNAVHFASLLPPDCTWSIFGVAQKQFPMVAMGVLLGGHVRVGFEDNLYLSKGVKATSNAELVQRAVEIIRSVNGEVATVDEARVILGLPD